MKPVDVAPVIVTDVVERAVTTVADKPPAFELMIIAGIFVYAIANVCVAVPKSEVKYITVFLYAEPASTVLNEQLPDVEPLIDVGVLLFKIAPLT